MKTNHHSAIGSRAGRVGRRRPPTRGMIRGGALRRGAVTVEFAIIAPIFLLLLLGTLESVRIFSMQNQLAHAAREGARMATMERTGMIPDGQSRNQKLTQDVRNFMRAAGVAPSNVNDIQVAVVDPDSGATFDLDDPDNKYRKFSVEIRVPYGSVTNYAPPGTESYAFTGKVTFRNGPSTVVQ